jgi:hypothetical protein
MLEKALDENTPDIMPLWKETCTSEKGACLSNGTVPAVAIEEVLS